MVTKPPTTGNASLDGYLKEIYQELVELETKARPEDGWALTDLATPVSEVIGDKRDLIDIVTKWDGSAAQIEQWESVIATQAGTITKLTGYLDQIEDKAKIFAQVFEWWDQNFHLIVGAQDSSRKIEETYTKIQTSEANAKTSEANAKTSETNAKTSETAAKASETAAKASQTAAKTSETNAATSETNAANSESAAATSETNSKTSETNAANSESAAATSETNAKSSESAAKDSELKAKSSEDAAKTSEDNAKASELAAKSSQTAASESQSAAKTSETAAASSKTAAESSATKAKTSEANAKTSEANANNSASAAKTSETNAKASENAANNSFTAASSSASTAQEAARTAGTQADRSKSEADRAAASAQQAEETVTSGVPDATTSVRGKVKLAGDLAGTADAPTVPGLTSKADKSYVQPTVDAVTAATYSATASTIMKRTSTGAVSVSDPTANAHAANKKYVDDQVATGSPDATTSAKGKVKLAGDLAGTADAPTVPGLTSKADKSYVQPTIDDVTAATNSPTANTLMRRTGAGSVFVATPEVNGHAATKGYVDSQNNLRLLATEVEGGNTPTASKVPRRTNTGGLLVSGDPISDNEVARKSYVDSKLSSVLSDEERQVIKISTKLGGRGFTVPRAANWGPANIGIETFYALNHSDVNANANYLTCPFAGRWKVTITGSRGGSYGTMYLRRYYGSSTADHLSWTDSAQATRTAEIPVLFGGDRVGLRWEGSAGNNFNYTVTMEWIGAS